MTWLACYCGLDWDTEKGERPFRLKLEAGPTTRVGVVVVVGASITSSDHVKLMLLSAFHYITLLIQSMARGDL